MVRRDIGLLRVNHAKPRALALSLEVLFVYVFVFLVRGAQCRSARSGILHALNALLGPIKKLLRGAAFRNAVGAAHMPRVTGANAWKQPVGRRKTAAWERWPVRSVAELLDMASLPGAG